MADRGRFTAARRAAWLAAWWLGLVAGAMAAPAPEPSAPPPAAVASAVPASSVASASPLAPATSATLRDAPPAAVPTAADPALEARMLAITGELRCLVCQNQTIADSHAGLAVDLRQEVRELIRRGRSDEQIRRYMTDRYGDFVLYKPPLKASTAVLWFGPAALLAIAVAALVAVIARRARLADDRFEPDPELDDDMAAAPPPSDPPPAAA